MHAELLLSDPLMFGHVEECTALYLLVLFLRRALLQMPPHRTAPLHHCDLLLITDSLFLAPNRCFAPATLGK